MPTTEEESPDKKSSSRLSQGLSKLKIKSKKDGNGATSQQQQQEQPLQQQHGQQQQQKQSQSSENPEDLTLPQTFLVKYLGKRDARGLWGVKHTRKPVDEMVAAAR